MVTRAEFYEPWRPQVGDRVRIQTSPECRIPALESSHAQALGIREGHAEWENGRTGTVLLTEPLDDEFAEIGHYYLVGWDQPHESGGHVIDKDYYAAIELIPLEESV